MSRLRLRPVVVLVGLLAVGHARGEQLLFYDFNDASNPAVAVDTSGNGNDGDVIDPALFTPDGSGRSGKPGDRAMDFGGFNNGAYVDVVPAIEGALDSITDNDQFTMSLWVLGNDDQPQAQWAFYAGPGRQIGSHIPWSDGTIYFDVTGCCGADTRINKNEPNPSLYRGQWNHYAFVKNEAYTAIYQNGALWHDSGQDLKNPMGFIEEFYLGAGPFDDQRSYSGLMDDVGLWNTALSDEEIQALAAGRPPFAVGGVGRIGAETFQGDQSNEVYGPEQAGVPGWSVRLVDTDLTIGSHTIAEDVLADPDEESVTGSYNVVDLAGGVGTFPVNHPYPNGVSDTSMEDFAVQAVADVVIPAGTWTIGFGSDDGGRIQILGVEFEDSLNNDNWEDDEIRYEIPRGHGWTVGSFELAEPLETTITAEFYERGGGDSFEVAVIDDIVIEAASPDTGWELLGDGVSDWSMTHTATPLVSADLTAAIVTEVPVEFDVNGDTDEADQLVVENPDPDVYTTILDVDGTTFQIAAVGALVDGDSFDIIDADQILGTPIITSVDPAQSWTFDPNTGQIVFGGGGVLTGDYNNNGQLDAGDLDMQAQAIDGGQHPAEFDLNQDGLVNFNDRQMWVDELKNTWIGDASLDGEFNSGDMVQVFARGKYEKQETAGWEDGDFNGDTRFGSSDMVAAFVGGGYEKGLKPGGPNAAISAVPEPSSVLLALLGVLSLIGLVRRR